LSLVVAGAQCFSAFHGLGTDLSRSGWTPRLGCRVYVEALRRHGVPEEILTHNGKVFTNRHGKFSMLESAFDRICRENGTVHRLTGVRAPTMTGKIERFHRTLKEELLNGRRFANIDAAQAAIDAWAATYNKDRRASPLACCAARTFSLGAACRVTRGAASRHRGGQGRSSAPSHDPRHDHD
jgi:Integrase core domain